MIKKVILFLIIPIIGFAIGFLIVYRYFLPPTVKKSMPVMEKILPEQEVIGFLPYWHTNKAKTDYSKYITNLSYFSLTIDKDGTIEKFTNPGESDPGYLALTRGKMDPFFASAKAKSINMSLVVFAANDKYIDELMKDPVKSANNLTGEVVPIMQKYGFSDLNLDVEQVKDASPEARLKFTNFVKQVKENLDASKVGRLSIDVTASSFVKTTNLANPKSLVPYVDKMIIMAYDYHYAASYVTGPVAPGEGAESVSEFDTKTAIEEALKIMPGNKIILGIPLYGYEWESIGNVPRSAVIPRSGLIISNQRAEEFLTKCSTCSATFDPVDKESHIIYKDQETGTYHQLFYPDKNSTQYKVDLAKHYKLGGIAMWALGYEGDTILQPLSSYRN